MRTPNVAERGAYVWVCEDGHRYAVSEIAMTDAVVEPRCSIMLGESTCNARLVRRAFRLPSIEGPVE